MKKLIFCLLVVLIGACKEKDDDKKPEENFAANFVGSYWTNTVAGSIGTEHTWDVTAVNSKQLKIVYNVAINGVVSGSVIKNNYSYTLNNVPVTDKETFTLSQSVDQTSNGKTVKVKLDGEGKLAVNAAGTTIVKINLKVTQENDGTSTTEYLEFKKK